MYGEQKYKYTLPTNVQITSNRISIIPTQPTTRNPIFFFRIKKLIRWLGIGDYSFKK